MQRHVADIMLAGSAGSSVSTPVLAHLMMSGAYERRVQRRRHIYRRRRNTLLDALSAELPQLQTLGIAGGLHVTLQLRARCDADHIAEAARDEGIDIRSLSHYPHLPVRQEPALALGYGRIPSPSVPVAIRLSAQILERPVE